MKLENLIQQHILNASMASLTYFALRVHGFQVQAHDAMKRYMEILEATIAVIITVMLDVRQWEHALI